jgi:hypothetical protein
LGLTPRVQVLRGARALLGLVRIRREGLLWVEAVLLESGSLLLKLLLLLELTICGKSGLHGDLLLLLRRGL